MNVFFFFFARSFLMRHVEATISIDLISANGALDLAVNST